MSNNLPIVTFGKYKNSCILNLLADEKYTEWLRKQSWLSKYTQIYNIIINHSPSNIDSKTPEHNKIQNLFLNNENRFKLLYKLKPINEIYDGLNNLYKLNDYDLYYGKDKKFDLNIKIKVIFEYKFNWDIMLNYHLKNKYEIIRHKQYVDKYSIMISSLMIVTKDIPYMSFNDDYNMVIKMDNIIMFEIKPLLSDDYPAVLRKMGQQIELTENYFRKHGISYCLLIGNFKSLYTTKDQLIEIFKQQNITVLFLADIFDTINNDDLRQKSIKDYFNKK